MARRGLAGWAQVAGQVHRVVENAQHEHCSRGFGRIEENKMHGLTPAKPWTQEHVGLAADRASADAACPRSMHKPSEAGCQSLPIGRFLPDAELGAGPDQGLVEVRLGKVRDFDGPRRIGHSGRGVDVPRAMKCASISAADANLVTRPVATSSRPS